MRRLHPCDRGAVAFCVAAIVFTTLCTGSQVSVRPGSGNDLAEKRALWTPVGLTGGGAMYMPSISPHDPNLMLVTCDMSGAYRTTDGGKTWDMIHHEHLLGSTRCRSAFDPRDPNVIFGAHGYRGELRVSRDRGQTWSPLGKGLPPGLLELAIDSTSGNFLLAGTQDGIYYSADSGQSWIQGAGFRDRPVGLHIGWSNSREQRRCFAASTTGFFRSLDSGVTWERSGEGLPEKPLVDFTGGSTADRCTLYCISEGEISGGKYVGGVYRSTDGGETRKQAMGKGIEVTERVFIRGERRSVIVPNYNLVVTTAESAVSV